jgi:hypothetical protein
MEICPLGTELFHADRHDQANRRTSQIYEYAKKPIKIYRSIKWTAVAQWLMYCGKHRKVAGPIPDGVIGIFHWHNPSDHTRALGSTQPLTEMSTRSISWG